MKQLQSQTPLEVFPPGTTVEVRDHFCDTWCSGFEVAAPTESGYLLRRLADRYVLPLVFAPYEIRRVR
jgi:hypothetical protein